MGDPKGIKGLSQKGNERCLETFDSGDDRNRCKTYVRRCVAQESTGMDEFKMCTEKGHCEKVKSFDECIAAALFLTGEFEQWGGPEKLVGTKVEPPAPVIKPDTVRPVGDDVYGKLGLDREKYNIYYVDKNEDLVLVDRIGVEKEPGFATRYPDDRIRRLSAGKDGKPVPESDAEVQALLAKWAIPTLENIDVQKLIEYLATKKQEVASLNNLVTTEPEKVDEIAKGYLAIIDAARAVYPLMVSKDNVSIVDETWKGALPQQILAGSGEFSYRLPYAMGEYYAKSGNVVLMDGALRQAKVLSDSITFSMIMIVRRRGYSVAIKRHLLDVEKTVSDGTAKIDELMQTAKRLEELLGVSVLNPATLDALFLPGEIVFEEGPKAVVYEDVKSRIDGLRKGACVLKAREILVDAKAKKLSGRPLQDVFDTVRALPRVMSVVDLRGGAELMEREIANVIQIDARIKIKELLDYAGKKFDEKPAPDSEKTRIDVVLEDQWLKYIDDTLDRAFKEAVDAGIRDEFAARIGAERSRAYKEKVGFQISMIDARTKEAPKTTSNGWYVDAEKLIREANETVDKGKMTDETEKVRLRGELNAAITRVKIARIEQLIARANREYEKRQLKGYDWFSPLKADLEDARGIVKQEKIGDGSFERRINALEAQVFQFKLMSIKEDVEKKIAAMPFFPFHNVKDNTYLGEINTYLDGLMATAGENGTREKYAAEVVQLRRRACERYYNFHINAAVAYLNNPPTEYERIEGEWFGQVKFNLDLAEAYLGYSHNGEPAFDQASIDAKRDDIIKKRKDSNFKEALRLRRRAESLYTTVQKVKGNENFLSDLNAKIEEARKRLVAAEAAKEAFDELDACRKSGYLAYLSVLWRNVDDELQKKGDGWEARALAYVDEAIRILTKDAIPGTSERIFSNAPVHDLDEKTERGRSWLEDFEDKRQEILKLASGSVTGEAMPAGSAKK